MARKSSEFVSGMGTGFEILKMLSQQVVDLGGSDEHLRRLLSDKKLQHEVAKLLVGSVSGLTTVDTTLGLAGLLAAVGAKDWTNGDIVNPNWNPPKVLDRGIYESAVELLPLGTDMTTDETETMVKAMPEYRLALPEETLAYSAKNPEAQRENPIVCLGAFWVSPRGIRRALVLDGDAGGRRVGLYWAYPEVRWDGRFRVAVVRKSL